MTTTKQFSSLNLIDHSGCIGGCLYCNSEAYLAEDVEKHCIDKQKIRDAINELKPTEEEFDPDNYAYNNALENLEKELGL